jgi:hypothetical protein
MDVREALKAICTTHEGFCWYCDTQLPEAEEAISTGWDVKRLEGERVASIILVCPTCQAQRAQLGEEEFLRHLSLRVCNATC